MHRFAQRAATIIPLGRTSRCGSSDLPEGSHFRAACAAWDGARSFAGAQLSGPGQPFPPIWSCTTRGLPCRRHYCRRGGLLPHLFTLTCARTMQTSRRFFLRSATGLRSAGGIFSVALSVTLPLARLRPLALPGALPFFASVVPVLRPTPPF